MNLSNTTFIIPLRIESDDRLRNVIVSSIYLLDNTDCQIIVKESDKTSVFAENALPQIRECVGDKADRLTHVFEENQEEYFHRTRLLNDMVMMTSTDGVINYDCDIILPLESYVTSEEKIVSGECDVVYPYGDGDWQFQIFATDELVSEFINGDYDLSILRTKSRVYDAKYGFCQAFATKKYIEGGLENENFIAYGYEDDERYFRFHKLGYNVCRLDAHVYHMEHVRTNNSWFTNPFIQNNKNLHDTLMEFDKAQLQEYYENQDYLKTRKAQLK